MSRTVENVTIWPLRTLPKDIGVAVVVLFALLLGLALRTSAEGSTRAYQSSDHAFSMSYPATWRSDSVTNTILLRAEDPQTDSAYKTNLTVEARELDPSSPPTLQSLVDRRIVQHGTLTAYDLLGTGERTLAGAKAAEIEYASVVQPIGVLRSVSLPVVVRSREYIVVTKTMAYYITMNAPESDFGNASGQFDQMLQSVKLQ